MAVGVDLVLAVVLCGFHLTVSSPTLTARPAEVRPGETPALTLTCSAKPDSQIGAVTSMTIYFTPDIPPSPTTAAASTTTSSQHAIHRRDAAQVFGGVVQPQNTPTPIVINPIVINPVVQPTSTQKTIVINPIVINPVGQTTSTPKPIVINPVTQAPANTPKPTATTKSSQTVGLSTVAPTGNPVTSPTNNPTTSPASNLTIQLANVGAFPDIVTHPTFNGNTTGHIGLRPDESNLTITIQQPTEMDTGKYQCKVNFIDRNTLYNTDITVDQQVILHKKTQHEFDTEIEKLVTQMKDDISEMKRRWNQVDNNSVFHHSSIFKNRKYILSRSQVQDVNLCQFICTVQGGYLAEFNDKDEFDFVRNFTSSLLKNEPDYPDVFVGATDRGHKGTWKFLLNSQESPYLAWGGSSSGYDCMILSQMAGFFMNEGECDGMNRFICELPV